MRLLLYNISINVITHMNRTVTHVNKTLDTLELNRDDDGILQNKAKAKKETTINKLKQK